jgi:hypothetical protein
MNITVDRQTFTTNSTIGSMSIDGVFQCYTLEPTYREVIGQPVPTWKVPDQTAIPAGTYVVTLRDSDRFKRIMPHVEAVPGFDGIEIHWGNYPKDTDGCTLVGQSRTVDMVGASQATFAALFPKLEAAADAGEAISITYQGTPTA